MKTLGTGFHAFDRVNHIHSFRYATEDAVTPLLARGAAKIEEIVIRYIDEELCRGGVGLLRTRHGNGATLVFEAVAGFVLDRRLSRFLLHAWFETPTLNHEAINDPMKNSVVIVA